jgi:hypothetical protein
MYDIQHCFICRPSDSTVSEDAGIYKLGLVAKCSSAVILKCKTTALAFLATASSGTYNLYFEQLQKQQVFLTFDEEAVLVEE